MALNKSLLSFDCAKMCREVTLTALLNMMACTAVYADRPEEWWHEQQKSNARARYILGIDGEAKPADRDESDFSYSYYGMGEARTLQQYWEFAGDSLRQPVSATAHICPKQLLHLAIFCSKSICCCPACLGMQ